MFCKHCGNEIKDEQEVCLNCGFRIEPQVTAASNQQSAPTDVVFCRHCGKPMQKDQAICLGCGFAADDVANKTTEKDIPVTGLKVLSFLIPLIGLILYISNADKKPYSAKQYGKWALYSVGFTVGLGIIACLFSAIIYAL